MYFNINTMRHVGQEKEGFHLIRKNGSMDYLFIHFISPVIITLTNRSFLTEPNACILYSPEFYHDFKVLDWPIVHDWIHFIPSDLNIFSRLGIPFDHIFYPSISPFISELIKYMEIEFINKEPLWDLKVDSLMLNLLSSIGREIGMLSSKESVYSDPTRNLFNNLRVKIYSNPGHWDILKMSKDVGFSRSRFSALYRQFFNISPGEDINNAALERSKYLLTATSLKITEIANDIGYESVEYFVRRFKEKLNVTPGAYRKELR